MKNKIVVLMGGLSNERKISFLTGKACTNALRKKGYRVREIDPKGYFVDKLKKIKPDAIIHYAEQPSAPYSMIGRDQAVFTQHNNIIGTLNLLFAVKKNAFQ